MNLFVKNGRPPVGSEAVRSSMVPALRWLIWFRAVLVDYWDIHTCQHSHWKTPSRKLLSCSRKSSSRAPRCTSTIVTGKWKVRYMKNLATIVLVGLSLYATAGVLPPNVTMPKAEQASVGKCKNRCVEKERSCSLRCKKEDKGHKRYDECKRDCSEEKIGCEKECEESK